MIYRVYKLAVHQHIQPKILIKYMHYSPLLLLLLLPSCLPLTDTTLQNCPSQYNISKANQTSQTNIDLINTFYQSFYSYADNQRIENIVVSGNVNDLWAYAKEKIVPYAIYAAIVLVVFIGVLAYCLFQRSFPPCEGLRRNVMEKPYTKLQKRCMSYWLLILAALIFSAGIVSFTTIPKMKTYLSYTKCSIYNMLDVTVNGDTTRGWGGFQDLKNKIGNISSLLDSAATQVTTYISGDSWLVDNIVEMKNKNIAIYNMNQNAKYISPNPTTTETNLTAGLDYPTIDSVFIRTKLGPNGTISTMVDDIDRTIRFIQTKSKSAYTIQQSARTMVQGTPVIKINSVGAQNNLAMFLRQLDVLKGEIDTFAVQFFQQYFSLGVYVLQGVVGFVLVSSLLLIIGGLSTHFYEIFQCRYMVHCGWCLYALMYFGMLVLAFVSVSLGSVGYYSCSYFQSSMTNSTNYQKIGQNYAQNVFTKLDTCILGDGNVLKKFNVYNEMRTVTDVFTNISTYFDYDNPSSTNYINLSISTAKIQRWISQIQKYRLGINDDSRPQETTNDNPNYAIGQLNLYSNIGGGVQTCSRDRWVFDKTKCTDPSQEIYTSDATLANGQALSFSRGIVTCISLNQKLTTATNNSWSQSDIIYRYLQIRQSCPDSYTKIISYASTLINYRDSRIMLFQGIKDQLTQLYTINTNFNNIMLSYRLKVNQFYQSVAKLNNFITNSVNGLLVTADCTVVGDGTIAIYNIFCVNFMMEIVKIGICSLVLLVGMLGAICVGAIFGVRYANVELLRRVNADHEEILQVSSQDNVAKNLDKEIMFSEHSHSSQEDDDKEKDKKQSKQ